MAKSHVADHQYKYVFILVTIGVSRAQWFNSLAFGVIQPALIQLVSWCEFYQDRLQR